MPSPADGRFKSGRPPTREEVLGEIARELAVRRGSVFPRWVSEGKMTQKQADERIDRLQAAYDYIGEHWPATQRALL